MIRKYLSEYSVQDIEELFKEKHNCAECPWVIVWKGKIPFSCHDYHRMYCRLRYVFRSGLNLIMGTNYDAIQTDLVIDKIKYARETNSDDLSFSLLPDTVTIHPNNNELLMLSVLVVKELGTCPIDKEKAGIETMSKELKKEYKQWQDKYGKLGISIQDKAKIREEQVMALQGRNIINE
jgi:hypothetical protein